MRVRSKANPDVVGTVLEDAGSELWVQWDDYEYPGQRWRIARDRVEEIPEPERNIHLSLLDALDRLRDSFNLAIECCIRDIQREMKK